MEEVIKNLCQEFMKGNPVPLMSSPALWPPFQTILAVKGVEYGTIKPSVLEKTPHWQVLAIPAGLNLVTAFLNQEFSAIANPDLLLSGVLLMGLGGGLSPQAIIGQGILYQGCGYLSTEGQWHYLTCDPELTEKLANYLGKEVLEGKGVSVDRVITQAVEKQSLGEKYGVDVVDMESYAVLAFFQDRGIPVAILRVISDDYRQDLPDLRDIFNQKGEIKPLTLLHRFLSKPIASGYLMLHSLKGLRRLKAIAQRLIPSGNS